MELTEALQTLRERRDWLTQRIKAKTVVGWGIQWDTRERDALTRVIDELTGDGPIRNVNQPPEQEVVIIGMSHNEGSFPLFASEMASDPRYKGFA